MEGEEEEVVSKEEKTASGNSMEGEEEEVVSKEEQNSNRIRRHHEQYGGR